MSRGRQRVEFEGLLQPNVLGTFPVIRGFADLRDLDAVSVAIPYEGSGLGYGTGYQRTLDEAHVEGIKRFLQRGRYRFFPEIILSLRSKGEDDPIVPFRKRRTDGSPIFKVVQKKRCKVLYRALKKSLKPPKSAVGVGSEQLHADRSVGASP